MKCPNCGTQNRGGKPLCAQCGHRLTGPKALDFPTFGAIGAMLGIGLTMALYFSGSLPPFVQFHPAPVGMEFEFRPSKGSAAVWAVELLGVTLAIVYLYTANAKARVALRARAALLGACWVTLGGMALCNFFSVGSLFDRRF